MTDTPAIAEGRVARVVGPVVDVEFPPDRIPPLYNALTVEVNLAGQGEGESSFTMTLEVAQHLGDNLVHDRAQAHGRPRARRPRHRHGCPHLRSRR